MSICVSLGEKTWSRCREVLEGLGKRQSDSGRQFMVEIRVDLVSCHGKGEMSDTELVKLFELAKEKNVASIVTVRDLARSGFTVERKKLMILGMESGAQYVDIEYEAPKEYSTFLQKSAKQTNTQIIISYHNYDLTPSSAELSEIISNCFSLGADIAKVATFAHSPKDSSRILGLYAENKFRQTILLGMGSHGKITRVSALSLGSVLTFASLSSDSTTAPGQLSLDEAILAEGLLETSTT